MATQKDYETMAFAELEKLYKGKCRQFRDLNDEIASVRAVLAHRQEVLAKEQELQALKERPIGAQPPVPSAEKYSPAKGAR